MSEIVNKINIQGTIQVGDDMYDKITNKEYPRDLILKVDIKGTQQFKDGDGNLKSRITNLVIRKLEVY